MALADVDPPPADQAPAVPGGRFVRSGGGREAEAVPVELAAAPGPLDVPPLPPSARDAEVRRAARARQAVVARWLRQLSR